MAHCHSSTMSRACTSRVTVLMAAFLLLALALQASLQLAAAADSDSGGSPPKLLLISLDSFGWDFLGKLPRSRLPNFDAFIKRGVHVRWVENVFPTVTRTNHMSLVSGLYAESHGVVHNDFYDPVLEASIPSQGRLSESDSEWVDMGAEPVWVTNSQAGEGRRSGTIYWPCADARIKGRLPDEIKRGEWAVSEETVSPYQRIDWALDWLTGESVQPLNFAAVYIHNPDKLSHAHGPDSQEVLDSIVSRDRILGHLMLKMKEKGLDEKLNVIITADHGQMAVVAELLINIDLFVDPSWYTTYPHLDLGTPMVNLWPKEGYYQRIVDSLKGKHHSLKVATSQDEDLVALHYSSNRRVAPIVLIAEPGWVIGTNKASVLAGDHGWDPRYTPQMRPFFIAAGPAFKQGLQDTEPFLIVDIYPLMCHILGLEPAPNNGSLSRTAHILSSPPAENDANHQESPSQPSNYTGVVTGMLVLSLAVVTVIVIIIAKKYKRKNENGSASDRWAFAEQAETHQATVNIVELGRTGKTQATGCPPVVPSLQQNEQPGPVAAGKTSARYRTAHQSN